MTTRKIIHVDMDAFYASVEQRDNPELRGKPVAVGGALQRGVVAAASYEARRFGVYSAMPSVTAKRKCPELIFVKPRFDAYKEVSEQVHAIFRDYTDLVEPLSLDEAYLDVTENKPGIALASDLAKDLRARIKQETGLTASAGISYCKFLAKMASGHRKPDGQTVIPPERGEAFVAALPIEKFYGVGPATARRMKAIGIATGADLRAQPLDVLQRNFGKLGPWFYNIARGIDDRPVRPNRVRKSIGAERTFSTDIHTLEEAKAQLEPIIEKVARACAAKNVAGRTVTLKVKYADFEQITRRVTVGVSVADIAGITPPAYRLLSEVFPSERGVRLLGVSLSGFKNAEASIEQARMVL